MSPIRYHFGLLLALAAGLTQCLALAMLVDGRGRRPFLIQNLWNIMASFPIEKSKSTINRVQLEVLEDPNTYSSVVYRPQKSQKNPQTKYPCIIFLMGAGDNSNPDALSSLTKTNGQYRALLPSLLADGIAPTAVMENFIVVTPYAYNLRSLYSEPRSKLLRYVESVVDQEPLQASIDTNRIFLFGFSDGATLAIELLTTKRFAGAVICSYGFVGTLPRLAIERLKDVPVWVFHSVDDVIFRVQNSDRLIASLSQQENLASFTNTTTIKYTRYQNDPEGLVGQARGHTTGITASRCTEVYEWLLALPSLVTTTAY